MLSRVRKSPWRVRLLAFCGLIFLILGVISVNPFFLFPSAGCGGIILWLAVASWADDVVDGPVKPKPSLQVPAPFGAGPVDWNSLAALELAMYGQRFPARLYREHPGVLIFSEKQARRWITGRTVASYPRDELVFASEPGIDPEDDEWWNLFRLPGYSAPDAGKPTSSSTEQSSGAPSASTSALAANEDHIRRHVGIPSPAMAGTRTLTAKDAAAIWPDAIIDGWTPWGTARTLREYAKSFPDARFTPNDEALRRLKNHVGTSSKNLRLSDDAFRADPDDSTRSQFNRLLREAAQIGQMLESLERYGDVNTKTYGDLVREQRRLITQAKSLFPALMDEDRKRGTMILPDGAEVTPLSITTKKDLPDGPRGLPYNLRTPDPPGTAPASFKIADTTRPGLYGMIPSRGRATTTMSQRAVNAARGREFLGATKPYSTCEDRLGIYWKIIDGEL